MNVLVLAPMGVEEFAVRRAGRVFRTGMGPAHARIAAARALAIDADAVVVAGLCGAVDPSLAPGDVVCATDLRLADGTTAAAPASAELARVLERHGLRVCTGTVVSTDHILTPAERAAVDGALAVDMESAWLAAAAGGRPFAVVRVVVDRAGRRLADPRIAADGFKALRQLRRAAAAIPEWAAGTAIVAAMANRAQDAVS